MFWILGLTGNGVDRTGLRVSVTGVSSPLAAVLEVSYVYDLGGRPPMRSGTLPARHLLSLIASSHPLVVEAEGSGTFLSIRFTPDPRLAPAAEALLGHCPRG